MATTLQQLTLAQAGNQFPGCLTDELLEVDATNQLEAGYHKLATYNGKLYSCTYEIGWLGWSVWQDGEWQDLDHADGDLFGRWLEEDRFTFVDPQV